MKIKISPEKLISCFEFINTEIIGIPPGISIIIANIDISLWNFILNIVYYLFLIGVIGCIVFLYRRKKNALPQVMLELRQRVNEIIRVLNINTAYIQKTFNINKSLLFIILITFSYIWLIANIAPDMGNYLDRYFFCVFPFVSLILVAILSTMFNKITNKPIVGNVILFTSVVLIIFGSHINSHKEYLFVNSEVRTYFNNESVGSDSIYVTDSDYILHSMSNVFMYSNRIFPTRPSDIEQIIQAVYDMDNTKNNMLVISNNINLKDHNRILEQIKNKTKWSPVFLFERENYTITYKVYMLESTN